MRQIHGAHQGNFFVRIGSLYHGIYKPGGAEGSLVHQRRIVSVQNDITRIQGVQNRSAGGHPIGNSVQVFGFVQLLVQAVDFSGEVMFDEVLIALQLGGRITAHVLVVIAGYGRVEHVYRKVKNAVLRVFIGLDNFVHLALCEGLGEVLGRGKMVCVQVTLAHHKEVRGAKKADTGHGHPLASLLGIGPPEQGGRGKDKEERNACVGFEEGYAVQHQGVNQHILHLGIGGRCESAKKAGDHPAKQTEAAREPEGPGKALLELFLGVFFLENLVQGEETQHRQRYLQHHQRHGNRTELIVKRQHLKTEPGKGHEMASHGHEDGQNGGHHQPPFPASFVQEQAQHKEEHAYGAHVHGAGGEGLRAPVQRQVLGRFLEVALPGFFQELDGFRLVGVHGAGRGAAVEVGDHEVGKLFPAVAPGGGIVQIQALGVGAFLGQFGAAAHGVRRIFGQGQQLVGVGGNARHSQHQQEDRCRQERLPILGFNGMNQFYQGIEDDHDGQVVGNLLMVGLHLHAERQAEEHGSKEAFPSTIGLVRINQRSQHPGHEGDGLHLGVVAHLNNLEVVAAECDGYGTAHRDGQAYAQGQEQQQRTQHSDKEPGGRTFAGEQGLVQRLGIVSAVLGGDGRGGHTAEHGICPVGGVVRVGLIPLAHFVGHAHITGNIALVHYFSFQHLRHKAVTEGQEQHNNAQGNANFLEQFFIHVYLLFPEDPPGPW